MRAVIQRVSSASVAVGGDVRGAIGRGLVVLVAVEPGDGPGDIEWMSGKIVRLRIFADEAGLMNRSVMEARGEILVISQFTLMGDARRGNRPSFSGAAPGSVAQPVYEALVRRIEGDLGRGVATGEFGAEMAVTLVNDGPVTLILESRESR